MGALRIANLSDADYKFISASYDADYLTKEAELSLVARMRAGDARAKEDLIKAHIRFVSGLVRKNYSAFKFDFMDLLSQGMLGLSIAADKFNPDFSTRFVTYAQHYVFMEINQFMLKNSANLRVPEASMKRYFKMLKRRKELDALGYAEGDIIRTLSIEFEVSQEEISLIDVAMNEAKRLDAPMGDDGVNGSTLGDLIADSEAANPEEVLLEDDDAKAQLYQLENAMTFLNDRERDILKCRRLLEDPITLEELAGKYGVSRERIRQIEVNAFGKVRKYMLGL